MKASEARRLNDEYAAQQQLSLEEIYKSIRRAATLGRSQVSVNLLKIDHSYRGRVYGTLKQQLEENGYQVSRSQWSDPRDNDNGDSLIIRW